MTYFSTKESIFTYAYFGNFFPLFYEHHFDAYVCRCLSTEVCY